MLTSPHEQPPHADLASQLLGALVKAQLVQRRPDLNKWEQEIGQLVQQVPLARVRHVLEWHCANLRQPYAIQAYSAQSFRQKFEKIEEAMVRSSPKAKVTITPFARDCTDRLRNNYGWPPEILAELASLVQLSIDRLGDFLNRLYTVKKKYAEMLAAKLVQQAPSRAVSTRDEFNQNFIDRVNGMHLGDVKFIEREWFPFMHDKYGSRPTYKGNPRSLVFDPATQTFLVSFWQDWAVQWAGIDGMERYNPLLAEILALETHQIAQEGRSWIEVKRVHTDAESAFLSDPG